MRPDQRIEDVRHENLLSLIDEYGAKFGQRGAATKLADAAGISPGYLSQLKMRRKGIGSITAEALEKAGGKPAGWMDTPRSMLTPNNAAEAAFLMSMLALYRSVTPTKRKLMERILAEAQK